MLDERRDGEPRAIVLAERLARAESRREAYFPLRVYCAKLGRVVSPGRCPGCDEAVPALEGTLR